MATGSKPRPIKGTPGSRIRVILGKTGSEYVLIMNEDDGASVWQTVDWSLASGIPDKIPRQINNCVNKGRYVKELDFNTTTGAWYVNGVRRDGTGSHSWWGSTEASETIQEAIEAKVSFGSMRNDYTYEEEETYAVIEGRNGFTLSSNLQKDLKKRICRMNRLNKEIKFVRLFDDGGYYISDDEGTQWNGLGEHACKELKQGRGGAVNDVAIASDGSWIVFRDHHFVSSTGVSQKLERKLTSFYSRQKSRNEARQREINEFVSRVQQAEQERLAREAAERERAKREAREEQERLAREAAERERAEAQERERLAREAAERERAEKQERERLELEAQKFVSELQEQCKEIQVLENLINKRKREVRSSLESLPPSRRASIEAASIWKSSASSSKAECVICHDGEAERALIPCGHHCLCDDCSEQLVNAAPRCPLCREPVQSTLKIYGQS